VLYNVFFTPLDIGFEMQMPPYWTFVDYIIDFMFFLDISFTFRTALIDQYGRINPNTWDIAGSYFRNWFFIDLLASLPLTIMNGVIGNYLFSLLSYLHSKTHLYFSQNSENPQSPTSIPYR